MKKYGTLASFAFLVLAAASVWLGGLNQDEGWYLYAARLVAEGKMPYRDFFYTQGPLLPLVYSVFAPAWENFGIVGGRLVTLAIGFLSLVFAAATARLLGPQSRKGAAGTIAFMLLGCNLYHVYYETIPKTYALASFFLMMGIYLLSFALVRMRGIASQLMLFASGVTMAHAAGARISLAAAIAAVAAGLALAFRQRKFAFVPFSLGAALGIAAVYAPFMVDEAARSGLVNAQAYHAARGGFDAVFTIGSISRLVRWYAPVFVLLGMVLLRRKSPDVLECANAESSSLPLNLIIGAFAAVFILQMLAPYPYEDYQVPVMALLAVFVAAKIVANVSLNPKRIVLLTLGMTCALAFSSPLLEQWTTNGHDRFWSLKKHETELAQLSRVAELVEALDPGGDMLLTQDLYLAIEANRHVPQGLEMGPFSMLNHDEWVHLLSSAPAGVAALSGYTFAINPPVCTERDIKEQMEFWKILTKDYDIVMRENFFGQHATPLLILKRKGAAQ